LIDALPEGSLIGDKMEGCVPFCTDLQFYSALNTSTAITAEWMINPEVFAGKSFSYCFNQAGTYTITGRFADTLSGCKNAMDFYVQAYALPEADFEYKPDIPIAGSDDVIFTNTSIGEELIKWSWHFYVQPGRSETIKGENAGYFYGEAGKFPVAMVIMNKWGCSDSIIKTVVVEEDFTLYVPNAFTPNGDGLNDDFDPFTKFLTKYEIHVFNQWGELVFVSNDENQNWDGKYKGTEAMEGVYTYVISYSYKYKNEEFSNEEKGFISLIK
jgi:gliding motility-associated-like protein